MENSVLFSLQRSPGAVWSYCTSVYECEVECLFIFQICVNASALSSARACCRCSLVGHCELQCRFWNQDLCYIALLTDPCQHQQAQCPGTTQTFPLEAAGQSDSRVLFLSGRSLFPKLASARRSTMAKHDVDKNKCALFGVIRTGWILMFEVEGGAGLALHILLLFVLFSFSKLLAISLTYPLIFSGMPRKIPLPSQGFQDVMFPSIAGLI